MAGRLAWLRLEGPNRAGPCWLAGKIAEPNFESQVAKNFVFETMETRWSGSLFRAVVLFWWISVP